MTPDYLSYFKEVSRIGNEKGLTPDRLKEGSPDRLYLYPKKRTEHGNDRPMPPLADLGYYRNIKVSSDAETYTDAGIDKSEYRPFGRDLIKLPMPNGGSRKVQSYALTTSLSYGYEDKIQSYRHQTKKPLFPLSLEQYVFFGCYPSEGKPLGEEGLSNVLASFIKEQKYCKTKNLRNLQRDCKRHFNDIADIYILLTRCLGYSEERSQFKMPESYSELLTRSMDLMQFVTQSAKEELTRFSQMEEEETSQGISYRAFYAKWIIDDCNEIIESINSRSIDLSKDKPDERIKAFLYEHIYMNPNQSQDFSSVSLYKEDEDYDSKNHLISLGENSKTFIMLAPPRPTFLTYKDIDEINQSKGHPYFFKRLKEDKEERKSLQEQLLKANSDLIQMKKAKATEDAEKQKDLIGLLEQRIASLNESITKAKAELQLVEYDGKYIVPSKSPRNGFIVQEEPSGIVKIYDERKDYEKENNYFIRHKELPPEDFVYLINRKTDLYLAMMNIQTEIDRKVHEATAKSDSREKAWMIHFTNEEIVSLVAPNPRFSYNSINDAENKANNIVNRKAYIIEARDRFCRLCEVLRNMTLVSGTTRQKAITSIVAEIYPLSAQNNSTNSFANGTVKEGVELSVPLGYWQSVYDETHPRNSQNHFFLTFQKGSRLNTLSIEARRLLNRLRIAMNHDEPILKRTKPEWRRERELKKESFYSYLGYSLDDRYAIGKIINAMNELKQADFIDFDAEVLAKCLKGKAKTIKVVLLHQNIPDE